MGRSLHFRGGSFYRIDDRTGFAQRAERTKPEWNGLIVDETVWEPRQSQDLVKGVPDFQAVPNPRPVAPNQFVGPIYVQTSEPANPQSVVIGMTDTSPFFDGESILIMMDNGVNFPTTVSGDPSATEITIADPLLDSVAAGNVVTIIALSSPAPVPPPPTPQPPVNTVAPSIDRAVAGEVTTGNIGLWTGAEPITYTFTYKVDGVTVATAQTYTPLEADDGKTLQWFVVGHNFVDNSTPAPSNSITITSASTAPVNRVAPSINQAVVGSVTTCNPGEWDGSPTPTYGYQFYLDDGAVGTRTNNPNHTWEMADDGKSAKCGVIATNIHGSSDEVFSNAIEVSTSAGIAIHNRAEFDAVWGMPDSGGKIYDFVGTFSLGNLGLFNADYSVGGPLGGPVTFRGQDVASVTVDYLVGSNVQGLTWESTTFTSKDPSSGGSVFFSGGTRTSVTFNQNITDSGSAPGEQDGFGYYFRGIPNGVIVVNGIGDSDIPDVIGRNSAVTMSQCDTSTSINVHNLTGANCGVDFIIGSGVNNVTVDANASFGQRSGAGDHPDFIQFFADFETAAPSTNLTITNNLAMRKDADGLGDGIQGVFLEDCNTVLVENNAIYSDVFNAGYSNARGSNQTNNNNYGQGFTSGAGGSMNTRGGASHTTTTNNKCSSVSNDPEDGPNPFYTPNPLPGSNTDIPDVAYGDMTYLLAFLTATPTCRKPFT